MAIAPCSPHDSPFGSNGYACLSVGELLQQRRDAGVAIAAFNGQSTLRYGGQARFSGQTFGDSVRPTEPNQAGAGQDDRVYLPLFSTPQTRVHIAA
jgi:hypothetical protein